MKKQRKRCVPLCPRDTEELAEEYYFGRLSEARTAALERHLAECPACTALVRDTFQFIRAFRAASCGAETARKRAASARRA